MPGPDGVTYECWKELVSKDAGALNGILETGLNKKLYPVTLFQSNVKPLPKKAGRSEIRPISFLNTVFNLIDRLFLNYLKFEIGLDEELLEEQHGFRKGNSSTEQTTRSQNKLEESKIKKRKSILFSADLKGAYDRDSIPCFEEVRFETSVENSHLMCDVQLEV